MSPDQGQPCTRITDLEKVSRLKLVIHLASVIDVKRDKLEHAITAQRQQQIGRQLEALVADFQREYEEFLQATEPNYRPQSRAA
jgi:hypothetical protein